MHDLLVGTLSIGIPSIINRTLHGRLEIQNFVSPRGHVISSISANLCRVKRPFKPYQNEHNSVKDTEKKGKKT